METIQIKNQTIKLDNEDYLKAIQYKWYISKNIVYAKVEGKNITFSKLVFNIEPGYLIWHKNNDPFDFTRDNILFISRSEFGRYINKEKKSRYHNVHWDAHKKSWIVNIDKENKRYFGGRYPVEKDAAIVADYFNTKIYRTKAKHNFKWKYEDLLIEAYNKILDKYGDSTSERISIVHQGKIINKENGKTSQYVGVYRNKRKQKWVAEIRKDRKRYFLGYYDSEKDAAKAYDKKAIELYGDKASTNF